MTALTARKDIVALRAAAIRRVTADCGLARSRYITVAPGQDMIYLTKQTEALRFLAAYPSPEAVPDPIDATPATGFPFLVAEVGITAPTAWELASLWVERTVLYRTLGAAIEAIRLGAVGAIQSATVPAAIDAAEASVAAGLALLPESG